MKIILIVMMLLLAACDITMTSKSLVEKGIEECKNVPELDGQQTYCVYGYIKTQCMVKDLDLRICGELLRN